MRKKILLIFILMVLIGGIYFIKSKKEEPLECCADVMDKRGGNYCFYKTPDNMEYSNPNLHFRWFPEGIKVFEYVMDDNELIDIKERGIVDKANILEHMIRDNSSRTLDEPMGGGWHKYMCISTGETPEVIDYFYWTSCKEEDKFKAGLGHTRKAIICGDIYFVQDWTSTNGPIVMGPFSLEE